MGTNFGYKSKVMNRAGRTLLLPNVGTATDLIQSTSPDPYAITAIQQYPLGTKMVEGERAWRYCKNGAGGLTAGMVIQGAAASHADSDDDIGTATVCAIGATTVYVTGTTNIAVAANYYKEGYLIVNDEAGEGHSYKIKSHIAIVNAVETPIILYDPIVIGFTAATQIGLRKNPYDMAIVAAAGLTGTILGVATRIVTAAYYFWAQTGGPCAVNPKTAIALGTMVVGGVTAGQADDYTPVTTVATVAQIIGWPMTPAIADGESFLVFLTLDT